MNQRLILIALAVLLSSAAIAANYYLPPVRNYPGDSARFSTFQNTSGARGVEWGEIKKQISAFTHLSASRRIGTANQIFDLLTSANAKPLSIRADTAAGAYIRKLEIKDPTGKIVYWVNASGQMVFGTPTPLSISSVYPPNGATNVSNGVMFHYSSTTGGWDYWQRINATTPGVTYNKSTAVGLSTQYIQGLGIVPTGDSDGNTTWSFPNFSGAGGTTYTIKVVRGSIVQTDGESASSCGTAMTDISGICTSTFTMK